MIQLQSQTARLSTEAFVDLVAPILTLNEISNSASENQYSAKEWYADRFSLGVIEAAPMAYSREASHIRDISHLIVVCRYLVGRESGLHHGEVTERTAGPIYIIDQEVPCELIISRFECQMFYISKSDLGFVPGETNPNLEITRESLIGQLVHRSMDRVFQSLEEGCSAMPAGPANCFISCLKIALGAHPQRGDVRADARDALYRLICDYIEENLGDRTLGVSSILRRFGVSRAGLYRMFDAQGGVRLYINQRRALRALLEISRAPQRRGVLRAACERWGFSSQPNFNRQIKSLYDATPGAIFGARSAATPSRQSHQSFFRFIATLA
ncbi:MAG: AraC family transcriptional regulator [Pseudomonadota bacterium]